MWKRSSLILIVPLYLAADTFTTVTNFQGFTGVINTPTAQVIKDGSVEFAFSNQVDAYRIRHMKDQFTAQNYFINMGLLPNLEVSGRLANIEDKGPSNRAFLDRDLSGSAKYQIPYYHKYLPLIAIGAQDISGTADRYKAKFIVMTKQYAFVQGSIGYGFSSNHLDGLFGSLEIRATDWLYLASEYDTQDTRVGLRILSPKKILNRFTLSLTANKNLDDTKEKLSLSVNLKMPLGETHDNTETYDSRVDLPLPTSDRVEEHIYQPTLDKISAEQLQNHLERFQNALISFGFENIDIGMEGDNFYVAYENQVLDHNELDAIGVILGYMLKYQIPFERFSLVIKKSNQPVKRVTGSLVLYKAFIESLSQKSLKDFEYDIRIDTNFDNEPKKLFVKNANSSYLKTRVELAPGLTTFVATEVGVFDYLISLQPYMHWTLYKGFDLGVLTDIPVLKSDNFDDGGPFASYDEGAQIKSLFLNRSDTIGDFVNIASLGMYRDYLGGFDQLAYSRENHTIGLKVGYLQDDSQQVDERTIYLGSYTYYDDVYDTLVTLSGGKYYNQDTGFDIKFKRFFGDTAITLFYQNTTYEYIGLGVELPLTPRKVSDGYLQLKGKSDFAYSIRSSIRDASGENFVKPSGAINPSLPFDVNTRFLNRNRLSADYLRAHILRLRDAYFTYVK